MDQSTQHATGVGNTAQQWIGLRDTSSAATQHSTAMDRLTQHATGVGNTATSMDQSTQHATGVGNMVQQWIGLRNTSQRSQHSTAMVRALRCGQRGSMEWSLAPCTRTLHIVYEATSRKHGRMWFGAENNGGAGLYNIYLLHTDWTCSTGWRRALAASAIETIEL